MGHGDGRPGTPGNNTISGYTDNTISGPGPGSGAGERAGEGKATYSGAVVLLGIISFVLGVIAVAVPYWGLFRPHTGKHGVIIQNVNLLPHYKAFRC